MIILSHKRQDTIVMMIPCLCSFRSSSCDLRHKKIPRPNGLAASFLVVIPTRWEPRTNQSNGLRLLIFPQPLDRALKNQNAAPTTPPCFSRRLRSSLLHWADCLRRCAPPPCSSPFHRADKKRKTSTQCVLVFLGAMEGTRTPGLLIRSQSLYPAELPTHTFRSEHDVFYHEVRGLSTAFLKYFYIFQKRTSFL